LRRKLPDSSEIIRLVPSELDQGSGKLLEDGRNLVIYSEHRNAQAIVPDPLLSNYLYPDMPQFDALRTNLHFPDIAQSSFAEVECVRTAIQKSSRIPN
jgi:hypothetical protein